MTTMSRPKQAAEVLRRIRDSGCTSKGAVFVNGLNVWDTYIRECLPNLPNDWHLQLWEENIGALGALNWCFRQYPNEPWYGFIADDEYLMPESPGDWDNKLIDAAGSWGAAHGWETLHQGKRFQGYCVIGGDLARAVGYLAIPTCWHWYGFDSMWEWLQGPKFWGGGEAYKMYFVPEVRVEHRHAYVEKAPLDECYKLGESRNEQDRNAFADWIKNEMPLVVERIKKAKAECASPI